MNEPASELHPAPAGAAPHSLGWKTDPREVWLVLALSALLTVTIVSFSSRMGWLTLPSPYDDCGYIATSFDHADILYEHGPKRAIRHYYANPPMSPGNTLLGVMAIVVLGGQQSSFYFVNGVLVFFYLLLLARVLGPLPLRQKAPWLAAAAFLPLATRGIYDFRPDFPSAIFLAWAVVLSLEEIRRPPTIRGELKSALLFVVSLFFKPSVLLLVAPIYGMTIVYRLLVSPGSRTRLLRCMAVAQGIGALILIGLLGRGIPFHFARMYHVLVTMRGTYVGTEPATDWGFLLAGDSTTYALGKLWAVALLILGLALLRRRDALRILREHRLTFAGLGAAVATAYLIPTLTLSSRHYYQGFPLHALLIVAAFHAAGVLTAGDAGIGRVGQAVLRHAGITAAALLLYAFHFPPNEGRRGRDEGFAFLSAQTEFLDAIERELPGGNVLVGINFVHRINRGSLICEIARRGSSRIRIAVIDEHETTQASFPDLAARCDAILAARYTDDPIALNQLSGWSSDWLHSHPDFSRVSTLTAGALPIVLYRNTGKPIDLLGDSRLLRGFGRLEGPSARHGLVRAARWSVSRQLHAEIPSRTQRKARLAISCRYFPGLGGTRTLKVRHGLSSREFVVPDAERFHTYEMELDLQEGKNVIQFEIEAPGAAPDQGLLFDLLTLQSPSPAGPR